jgi:26S proteasome regulatory subunit N1
MAPKDKDAITITAGNEHDGNETKKTGGKKSDEELTDTMSDEDRELKDRLDTCVSTLINSENEAEVTAPIRLKALDVIVTELRTATSSMTSVPKPLKFLRRHFAVLKNLYTDTQNVSFANDNDMLELRARLADVLAVLAMTLGKPEGVCIFHVQTLLPFTV